MDTLSRQDPMIISEWHIAAARQSGWLIAEGFHGRCPQPRPPAFLLEIAQQELLSQFEEAADAAAFTPRKRADLLGLIAGRLGPVVEAALRQRWTALELIKQGHWPAPERQAAAA